MQFVMLSKTSLAVFTNRKFRLSLKLWKNVFQLECEELEFQIAYQNNNLKSVRADYIYRICYKNAKKANPENGFALIEKRYHRF